MNDLLAYYTVQSPFSDPGDYAWLYDDLPDNPAQLIPIINGQLIHYRMAKREKLSLSHSQRHEQRLRTIAQRLTRIHQLNPAPLTEARAVKERQLGWCREFALLMVSILRHKGIPARMRVGFANYFADDAFNTDHWVAEFWDNALAQWRLIDADLGAQSPELLESFVKKPLKPGIDLPHLRHGTDFNVAAAIWQRARAGEIKPDHYRANRRWKGWPCLRGNLLHDFQALNKTELMLWDYWDELSQKPEGEVNAQDRSLLDHIAALTLQPEETFAEMRSCFEALPRTRVIRSRLYLLGIGGQGQIADALRPSDFERLTAVIGSAQTTPATHRTPQATAPEETAVFPANPSNAIVIQGARQHNLKNINVTIPRNKLVVITGVSGSGKSSLAFDTIYAEGQRRYIESLSTLARQFTRQIPKPQVDKVIGLNPAVAIEQNSISPNSRSTVGSMTGVIDYLRVLFARIGQMHCPQCGRTVTPQTAQQMSYYLCQLPSGTSFQMMALADIDMAETGYQADVAESVLFDFSVPEPTGDMLFYNQVWQAVTQALAAGNGQIAIRLRGSIYYLTNEDLCPTCDLHLPKLEPQLLNPNSVFGMCSACDGSGLKRQVDPNLIIAKPDRSLLDDASSFYPYSNLRKSSSAWWRGQIEAIAAHYGADLERPWQDLPLAFQQTILYGTNGQKIDTRFTTEDGNLTVQSKREWHGAIHHINRLYRQTKSEVQRQRYRQFMRQQPCPACQGERLSPEARFVTLGSTRFPEVTHETIGTLLDWIRTEKVNLTEQQHQIGDELINEIEQRLQFICDVGLHYLSLDRAAPTLSGGEAQRIRLASQIGSELTGILYVLDEPTIGLHPRDQRALLDLLLHLCSAGNSMLVVEHDADLMRAADWLIDLGPGAGAFGGELVAAGTPLQVMANPDSLTGRYLAGDLQVTTSSTSLRPANGWLTLKGASLHNLQSLDVAFPLGTLTCITGVSGSGKSSLITGILYPALAQVLHRSQQVAGAYVSLEGVSQIDKVIHITQQPIGRNPRSNPATYTGIWTAIRQIFAQSPEAKKFAYEANHFSFNVAGGRCEACEGYGARKVKLQMMADIWVTCQECNGRRFNPQTLAIQVKGKSIADVLDMDVQEALLFFDDQPTVRRILQTLVDVGLGYIRLGQSALTLSGGEAQRIKLARELGRPAASKNLYILDEPTTGLHFADIQKLLAILHCLVDAGHTVIVIEHNLDVIKTADWIIDLGPEGGQAGGTVVAQGSPMEVAKVSDSYTAHYLREVLKNVK